ncbi:MAG: TonB-dependent receptor [Saprospiraceae bacterium]|nr:TonB-dependent receptor [Saprospiraceae bacterium]
MSRISTLLLLFIAITPSLLSQSVLKGRIELTGHAAPGVTISLQPGDLQTVTDANGQFRFDQLTAGVYELAIFSTEIMPQHRTVELAPGETLALILTAQAAEQTLREVTVYGARDFRGIGRLPEAGALQVNAGKKMEVVSLSALDANLAVNNARQVFAKVPGTHVWENDASGIQVNVATRGLSPNRSWEYNVRQNGYDVSADPIGYPEAYYNPPMEAVERLEVIRGAASLQYGPQFGGLLNYQLKSAPQDQKIGVESSQTLGAYGLFSSFNAIGGTSGKLDYYGYFHHRDGEGWRDNSRYSVQHGHVRLGYRFSPQWRAELEYTRMNYEAQQAGGLTDAQFTANPRQSVRSRNWFNVPWNLATARLRYDVSEKTRFELAVFGLAGQRNSVGFVRAINIADTINLATGAYNNRQLDRDQYRNWGSELRFLTNYSLGGREQTLNVGLRYFDGHTDRRQLGKGDTGTEFNLDLQTESFPRDMDFDTRNAALFAEHIFRAGKYFAFIPGLRFEHLRNNSAGRLNINGAGEALVITPQQRDRSFLLAGFATEFHATPTSEVYANIAQAYRPVGFSDLTPPATTDEIDPNLHDARGWVSDLGYRGRWKNILNFDVSLFYMRYADRVGTIARLRPDGSVYQYRTNLGLSIHKGAETYVELNPLNLWPSANRRWGALNLFAALSWTDARFSDFLVTTVSNGQITESNLAGKRVDNAPRYVHRLGATYAYRTFSATWQFSSVSEVFADANNTELPSANAQVGKLPGYTLLDLSATYTFATHYTIRAGINNLADARYATRRAGGYPGPGLLPGEGRSWYVGAGVKF